MADKINVKSFAWAIGVLWAFYMFSVGITSYFGWGRSFVVAMASIYIGFSPGLIGAIIGAVWGFFDGAVAGVVIAYVYNRCESGAPRRRRR